MSRLRGQIYNVWLSLRPRSACTCRKVAPVASGPRVMGHDIVRYEFRLHYERSTSESAFNIKNLLPTSFPVHIIHVLAYNPLLSTLYHLLFSVCQERKVHMHMHMDLADLL